MLDTNGNVLLIGSNNKFFKFQLEYRASANVFFYNETMLMLSHKPRRSEDDEKNMKKIKIERYLLRVANRFAQVDAQLSFAPFFIENFLIFLLISVSIRI